ncbi:hypothetical protein GCM10018773_43520 [Streptomyces candidus]|nr:hypothetical protein GCM10018773_43520 [Streptomyces candidus]
MTRSGGQQRLPAHVLMNRHVDRDPLPEPDRGEPVALLGRVLLFAVWTSGYPVFMTAQNSNAKSTATDAKSHATGAAKSTATDAKKAATDTKATAQDTTSQAKGAADKAKDATTPVKDVAGKATSAAQSATAAGLKGVQAGKQALESASGKVASKATTAWTLINNRKAIVAGAGAGVVALGAASFAAGRRVEQHSRGPLTKLLAGTKL